MLSEALVICIVTLSAAGFGFWLGQRALARSLKLLGFTFMNARCSHCNEPVRVLMFVSKS